MRLQLSASECWIVGTVSAVLISLFCYWRYGPPWLVTRERLAREATLAAEERNGWSTNCSGPEFSAFTEPPRNGPGPNLPLFKISSGLLLAVPRQYSPSTQLKEPAHRCQSIADVPQAPYLYFRFRGSWSENRYRQSDIPDEPDGQKRFLPDSITVRVDLDPPETRSADEVKAINEMLDSYKKSSRVDRGEMGGMHCESLGPIEGARIYCHGARADSEVDVTSLYYQQFFGPFVHMVADYRSAHFGRFHIYWWGWTADPTRALDIDRAVFSLLKKWNVVASPLH